MLGWCITQAAFAAQGAATGAILPDLIPESQRGKLSGLVAMAQQFGTVAGIAITEMVGGDLFRAFMIPAALGLAGVLALATVLPDRRLRERPAPLDLVGFFKRFWIDPREHPDFAWAFFGRFLMSLGFAIYGNYSVYFLMDRLGYTAAEIPRLLLTGTLVTLGTSSACAVLGGALSDRLGRRKAFVIGASLLFSVGIAVIAFSTSFGVFLLGGGIAGAAIGLYSAVDLALVTQVLPNRDDAAKDMGVFGIAGVLPQSLAPTMAPLFLAIGGGSNYVALYLAAAAFGLLGAAATQPIRGVR
jgi:MFS family permease